MKLAKDIGLNVANVELRRYQKYLTLLIKRFDRILKGNFISNHKISKIWYYFAQIIEKLSICCVKGYILENLIEKTLQNKPIVDYATLKSLLSQSGYKYINDKIKYMKKKGLLISLKKSLYIYKSPFKDSIVSKEIVANNLLGPSYISFDYALYYYGLIPEKVVEVTSSTTKRAKVFDTAIGVFSYKHIDKKLYSLGLQIQSTSYGNFLIATPLKALCDKVYTTKGVTIRSKKAMLEFLVDDLRIDLDELEELDTDVVKEYAKLSKSTRVEQLYKVLKDMQ